MSSNKEMLIESSITIYQELSKEFVVTYYSDLSPYGYRIECVRPNTFNVGWLSFDHPFEKGKVPAQFSDRLLEFCKSSFCKTRGWHICEFCNANENVPFKVEINEKTIVYLGSAEIRVVGDNMVFASPDLIYHYITAHQYLPPKEFIDAILNGPLPTSKEYKKLFWDLI